MIGLTVFVVYLMLGEEKKTKGKYYLFKAYKKQECK